MGFDWDLYPQTRDFVDGSGITRLTVNSGFRAMYNEACEIYKREGGEGDLGDQGSSHLHLI